MGHGARARGLTAVADLGLRRPGLVLVVLGLVTLVFAALIPGIGVSTSRTGLVSDEDPGQQRLFRFYDEFGRPEYAAFVVAGGQPDERRAFVDDLQARLTAEPGLGDRVLGRLTPRIVAPLVLLQQPGLLAELRERLPPDESIATLVPRGVPGWLQVLEDQIYEGLEGGPDEDGEDGEGEDGDETEGEGPPPAEEMTEGFDRLADLAGALDDHLRGADPLARFADTTGGLGQRGIDEHGYLVSDDGEYHLVSVFADLPSDEGREIEPLVTRLREVRDEARADAPEGITADLTGMPALIVDELQILGHGLMVSSIATTVGIALLVLLLFRSLGQTVVALLPLLPGVVGTLAAVHLLYDDLNLITSSFVAVLLGLGIDFSVHAVARYNEELRRGASRPDAVRVSLGQTGPGILTGAVVTAAAFLTTTTTEFTAFAELGLLTAIGLTLIVVAMFFAVPALLPRGKKVGRVAPEPPGMAKLAGLVRRLRTPLLLLGVLGGIGGAIGLTRIAWNPRYFDFLPSDTESARGLGRLEYDPIASPVFANLVAGSIEQAREMAETLRAMPTVAGVQTPSDLLPELSPEELAELREGFAGQPDPDFAVLRAQPLDAQTLRTRVVGMVDALDEVKAALAGLDRTEPALERALERFKALRDRLTEPTPDVEARVAELHSELADLLAPAWATAAAVAERGHYVPADLPPLFQRRYVSRDKQHVALFAVPAGEFWEKETAEAFAADVRSVYPDASGLAMIHVAHGDMIVSGFRRAAALAAGIVVLLLALDFRSLRDALLALLPTAIGWLWMLGVMVLLGLRFDVANIVSLPLVLGIGIAFGVHVMHRVREDDPKPQASTPGERPRLEPAVRGTGGAIMVAALTTIVGFAGLMLGEYGGMRSFGGVMVIGIFTCLVATILVLPAALLLVRRVD